jgi:hypothetical protein
VVPVVGHSAITHAENDLRIDVDKMIRAKTPKSGNFRHLEGRINGTDSVMEAEQGRTKRYLRALPSRMSFIEQAMGHKTRGGRRSCRGFYALEVARRRADADWRASVTK